MIATAIRGTATGFRHRVSRSWYFGG
jgi:hypothetical protein